MLTCTHHPRVAGEVTRLATLGRFLDVLEHGVAVLAAHTGNRGCRSRYAADLVQLAVVTEHALLTEALVTIVDDDEVTYLPSRARWMTPLADAWASAWFGRPDEADELVGELRARRRQPAEYRLLLAETELRSSPDGAEPGNPPRPPRHMLRAARRPWAHAAAVGYGLALLDHGHDDRGRPWLTALAHDLERQDPALFDEAGLPATTTIGAALNRWSWARAVLGLAGQPDDPKWTRARLPTVARFFAEVGNPLGAATAHALFAQSHGQDDDRQAAVRAAAAALEHTEDRFLVVSTVSKVKKWRKAVDIAHTAGLVAGDDAAKHRLFASVDSSRDWLGDPTTLDERMAASVAVFRTLFTHVEGRRLRRTFVQMIGNTLEPLRTAGAGGPLVRELVEMKREDVRTGDDPVLLARALGALADHHTDHGDVMSAVATDNEARSILHAIDPEETTEASTAAQARVDRLLTANRWADAVRMATAGDEMSDLVTVVRERALANSRTDVLEQLAAFRVESARTGDPAELVDALCEWATTRHRLLPGGGTPVLAEAIALTKTLAEADTRHTTTLVRAHLQAVEQGSGNGDLTELWQRCLAHSLPDKSLFATLTDLVAHDNKDAQGTVDVLTSAAEHLVAHMSTEEHWPRRLVDRVVDWSDDLLELGAVKAAARLLAALTTVPNLDTFHQALGHTQLGITLFELGDHAGAETALTKAITLEPDSSRAHRTLGQLHLEMGATDRALTTLNRAVELDPRRAWTHCLRADAWQALGNTEAALRDLSEATRLFPRSQAASSRLARVFRTLGTPEQTLQALTEAGAATSTQDWMRYQYGLALTENGDRTAAEQFFTDAWEIGCAPAHTIGWQRHTGDPNLGIYLLALGRDDEAIADCTNMLDTFPHNRFARELIEDLTELTAVLPERAAGARRIHVLAMRKIAR